MLLVLIKRFKFSKSCKFMKQKETRKKFAYYSFNSKRHGENWEK